ncbi:MAG: glycosyltransferase [Methanosarcinaceae archaeon]|nr:glycosyltransferase [Methanosarcinaceae archaeon]
MNHKVSIVVLTKNRPRYLKLCLDSIVKQTYDNLEYTVIDSNSNKETLDLINSYKSKIPLELFYAGECTIGKARQIGFKMSTGDIIAYIDSDVELPHEKWIEHMLKPFKCSHIAGVQTLAKYHDTDHPALKRIHSSFEYKSQTVDIDHYEPVGTSHILIRKVAIANVDGFKDINFKEDTDLTYRIMMQGHPFIYLPNEKCYHYHVDGYKSYFKKMFRNKLHGAVCLMRGVK